jgi:O-antigen/teichoic acid export membrane protein
MSLQARLFSQSTVIFGARLAGAGLIFLVQALIARFWGAELLGEYLVVIATVNLVAVVMPLGFHTVGTYFAAEYRARGERRQLLIFLLQSYGHVVGSLIVLLVLGQPVLFLLGQGESALAQHFVPAVLLAFAAALVYVNGALLVGLRRPIAGYIADGLFRPLVIAAVFVATVRFGAPGEAFSALLDGMAVGSVGISVIQFAFVVTSLRGLEDNVVPRSGEARRWWRFALPWVLISIATDFFFDVDLLLLSHSLGRDELAIFGVCTRIFALASFGVAAVYAVTLPDMFESEAKDDRQAFNRKVGDANLVATGISVALFAFMAVVGPILLTLFGPSFSAGAAPLAVLCLALVVRSALGPASLVLSIHDRPYASLPSVAMGIGALAIGNWLLVPVWGLMGAALAALIAISLWSVGQWWVALKTAGTDVSIMQWFRARQRAVVAAE